MARAFQKIGILFVLASWATLMVLGLPASAEGPARVAIFPFEFHAKESLDYLQDAIFVTISGRLIEEGSIEVVERKALRDALSRHQASQMDEATIREIAAELRADYAVSGTLTKVGELVNVDARLISIGGLGPPLGVTSEYRGLEEAMEGLGDFADRIRRRITMASATSKEEEKPSDKSTISSLYEKVVDGVRGDRPAPPRPAAGLETLQTFSTFLRGVDAGDVDGDGLNEILLIDNKSLWVYKQAGGRLRLFRKIEAHKNDNFLTLDVADLNRNGLSEIIVSNLRSGTLNSFILEFEERNIKKISDRQRWFFRVIDHPVKGPTLVGQKMSVSRRPIGGIYPFVWEGQTFRPEEKPLVSGHKIPVFGLTIGEVGGRGEVNIIYMDYQDRLRVLNQEGGNLWESGEHYGGSDIYYSLGSAGSDTAEKRVYLPPRLLVKDLDGDGKSEVIVSRNTFQLNIVEKLRRYDRARLVDLVWQGMGLVESWETPEIAGYISDYQIRDIDNDGRDEILMTAVSKGVLRSGASSALLVHELF